MQQLPQKVSQKELSENSLLRIKVTNGEQYIPYMGILYTFITHIN